MKSRKQIRLKNFDYASVDWYFVTICTKDRISHFGKIVDSLIQLSEIGQKALSCWKEIPEHYPNVELGEFVVMPNHIHGVINIFEANRKVLACNDPKPSKENPYLNLWMSSISPKPGSLSAIMRSYKSALTKWCNQNNYSEFGWQARFHDRIIRNQEELDNIENYIILNPSKWDSDENHI